MAGSTFGKLFRVTTFGESTVPQLAVLWMGVRRVSPCGKRTSTRFGSTPSGTSRLTTPRNETDQIES